MPPPKRKHTITQHRIAHALEPYAATHDLLVLVEAGFRIGKGRNEWLQADISVIAREQEERAAADPDGYYQAPHSSPSK